MAWSYSSGGTSGMSAIVGPFSSSQRSLWKLLFNQGVGLSIQFSYVEFAPRCVIFFCLFWWLICCCFFLGPLFRAGWDYVCCKCCLVTVVFVLTKLRKSLAILSKKGRTQCRELSLCAGFEEGCQWQALPSPVQCEETATRSRDLSVTDGKTLPLAPSHRNHILIVLSLKI